MRKLFAVCLVLLTSDLWPLISGAQTPQLINYQGRLLNGTNLVNGNVGLSLRLFDAATLGNLLYEDSNTVTIADGLYSTFIGDNTAFGSLTNALGASNVFIEVAVNGVALSPRERLVSAAYAVRSQKAEVFTGAVLDTQLSSNVALLNGTNQTFSGNVSFATNANVTGNFRGTFSGNGALVTNVSLAAVNIDQPPVIAWGYNFYGETTVPASATNVLKIAGGGGHSLALRGDGTVIAWGYGGDGETTVPVSATGVVAIAGGGSHSLALRGDGTVIAWGYNADGETTVPATATGVVAIAGGGSHSLALRGDGAVIAWGDNTYGQTTVPAIATGVVAIAGGGSHSLALRGDGTVIAWGDNTYGQTTVPASATGVVAIAGGDFHSLALRSDGTVIAWGFNYGGDTTVPAGATGVVAIAGGGYHSLALRGDGTVIAWGHNGNGQTTVPAGATGVVAIAGGGDHSLALRGTRAPASTVLVRLDAATNTFAGTVSATAFTGDGSGLTGITNFVNKTGDTMSGSLQISGGFTVTNTSGSFSYSGYPPGFGTVLLGQFIGASNNAPQLRFSRETGGSYMDIGQNINGDFVVEGNDTSRLVVQAGGNVGIGTTTPGQNLTVQTSTSDTNATAKLGLNAYGGHLWMLQSVSGYDTNATVTASTPAGSFQFVDATISTNNNIMTLTPGGKVGIGITNPTNKLDVAGSVGATVFNTTSDRNAKENFAPVNADDVLAKIAALPITQWNFKTEPDITHLGPMAQDFHAAFNLGMDDKHIATVDESGVALAAIQALKKELDAMKAENADLRARLDALEKK